MGVLVLHLLLGGGRGLVHSPRHQGLALAALESCPSWMRAAALLAFLFSWLRGSSTTAFFRPFLGGGRCALTASVHRAAASPDLHLLHASLTMWAADLPEDATSLGLALSTHRGKMYRRSHLLDEVGSAQTSPTVEARTLAQSSRADLGMCFMVGMMVTWTTSQEGRPSSCQVEMWPGGAPTSPGGGSS